jgi:NADH-quinone oxidoreductase subunit J
MTLEQSLFYILAAATVIATIFAITEKHPVHAIVYLVTSFFSLAAIFFLLAAPMIAAFEVIIYAGAVMVLFLFVIMMLDLGHPEKSARPGIGHWLPAIVLGGIIAVSVVISIANRTMAPLAVPTIGIKQFATVLFRNYGIAIEIISMQLLFAVVGALYLGRRRKE